MYKQGGHLVCNVLYELKLLSDTSKELFCYLRLDLYSLERFCGHRVGNRLSFFTLRDSLAILF